MATKIQNILGACVHDLLFSWQAVVVGELEAHLTEVNKHVGVALWVWGISAS